MIRAGQSHFQILGNRFDGEIVTFLADHNHVGSPDDYHVAPLRLPEHLGAAEQMDFVPDALRNDLGCSVSRQSVGIDSQFHYSYPAQIGRSRVPHWARSNQFESEKSKICHRQKYGVPEGNMTPMSESSASRLPLRYDPERDNRDDQNNGSNQISSVRIQGHGSPNHCGSASSVRSPSIGG